MNIKRALAFSVLLWVFIFVIWSILIFVPVLKDKQLSQYIIYWILLVPLVLLMAKWYFKQDSPSVKKGLSLALIALAVMTVLDLAITMPLFIGPEAGGYTEGLKQFYLSKKTLAGFAWFVALMLFAGWEFDRTFTKKTM